MLKHFTRTVMVFFFFACIFLPAVSAEPKELPDGALGYTWGTSPRFMPPTDNSPVRSGSSWLAQTFKPYTYKDYLPDDAADKKTKVRLTYKDGKFVGCTIDRLDPKKYLDVYLFLVERYGKPQETKKAYIWKSEKTQLELEKLDAGDISFAMNITAAGAVKTKILF